MNKKFIISSLAAFAMVATFSVASASTAQDMGTTTLRTGSRGMFVQALQSNLNTCAGQSLATDGVFGRGTAAGVRAFQVSKGLTADGLVGRDTRAAIVAHCASQTTSTTTSNVPGCTAGALFSSTTGQACSATTPSTVMSGTEGYLSEINSDSSNRVSTVYESESDKVVAGVRATAKLADQRVERIKVTMQQVSTTTASANLGKYISSVSLWNGSTKIATMSVVDADRSNVDDTYTFNFTGLNSVVSKDQIGRFYVSVNANGSLDSNDANSASVTVKIEELRATSPNGVYTTNGSSGSPLVTQTGLTFGKFAANGVKAEIGLASSNPAATTITVNENSNTNNVTLLNFKVTAKNTNLTLRRIPVSVATTGSSLDSMINSIKLIRNGNIVDQLDGSAHTAGVYSFNNLATNGNTISSGSSAEFSVVVDLKKQTNFSAPSATNTLTASFSDLSTSAFSVQDSNGDQLPTGSSFRSGSAIGSAMTLRVTGVAATIGSATAPVSSIGNSATQQVTFNVPMNLIGAGADYYVPKTAYLVTSTTLPSAIASQGIYFAIQNTTDSSFVSSAASFVDSPATVYGTNPQQLLATNSGVGATLKATINGDGTPAFYKLYVLGFGGSQTLNGSLTAYPVDNQSAFSVVSAGAVQ